MHIPDGYLSVQWSLFTYVISIAWLLFVIYWVRRSNDFSNSRIGLLTVLAAGVFAAQMLNWPLPGGTSLHFVGGALSGILLGPLYGSLVLYLVVIVQCLFFHDGGLTALGANLLNMAIIDVLVGYGLYMLITRIIGVNNKGVLIGAFLGGWMGIFTAGLMAGVEIGLSPLFPYGLSVTLPIMGGWHFLLGIIEGLITGLVVFYLWNKYPEIIHGEAKKSMVGL